MLTAIILAAGEASRMGRLKQLLPWGEDSTMLETVINNFSASSYIDDRIRVVLGAQADRIRPVLKRWTESRLEIIENDLYQQGMLSSIRAGLQDLPENTHYIMIALGDQPLITTEILNTIIRAFYEKRSDIMVPVFKGRRGHPLLFNRKLLPEIDKLNGPGGLRNLLKKYPEKVEHFEVESHGIIIDFDYYQEYLSYRKKMG